MVAQTMTRPAPLFAGEKRMAELLDMDRRLFRRLVADGILPGANRRNGGTWRR